MYQSLKLTLLNVSSSTLDDISSEIINSGGRAMKSGYGTVKGLFDTVVVPSALLVVLLIIFWLILSISYAKKRKDGEGVQEKVSWLLLSFVVFGLLAGYGAIFGGLFNMVLGGAA